MTGIALWVLAALVALLLAGVLGLWATGRFARLRRGRPSRVLRAGRTTALDQLAAAPAPGLSGARLVEDGPEALALRLAMTRLAGRSLDLLYYIWDDDLTGRLLAQELLAAADRGVRVRLLLDDVNVLGRDPIYRTLDRHPRIEVRLFNPIRSRERGFLRGVEVLLAFLPYNRRMHGKLWLADGRLALLGGRNVGDTYFGAQAGGGYHDLDLLAAGAVLAPLGALFDRFWNSDVAMPIRLLWPKTTGRLSRIRTRLARRLAAHSAQERLAALALPDPEADSSTLGLARLHWSRHLTPLGDPPEKSLGAARDGWLPAALIPMLRRARQRVRIMTPYFVPGRQGMEELIALRRAGVEVEVLTNGLALSDNPLVHSAYLWYRARLLSQGVRLIELAPGPDGKRMLHGKALMIDGAEAFVGSFNFDLRSAFLNTETGLLFQDPPLLAELAALFDRLSAPDSAWHLSFDAGRIRWKRGARTCLYEPDSTAPRRVLSWLIGHLPIHRLL